MMITRIASYNYCPARTQSFGKSNKPKNDQNNQIAEQIKMLEEKKATEEAFGNYTDAEYYAQQIKELTKKNGNTDTK